MTDLLIIGGGVAGTLAYLTYKKKHPDKHVLIVESNDRLLRKLQATGNGRCNFTNDNFDISYYNNGEIFKDILENGNNKVLSFMDSLNISYFKDAEGRYYPMSESAKTLAYIMSSKVNKKDVILNASIDIIEKKDDIFNVMVTDKINMAHCIRAKALLIATGSKNYPSLGSNFSIKPFVSKLGHKFTDIYPSNIYIKVKEKDILKKISGSKIKANVSLYNDNKLYYEEFGEVLFKDDALSGIVIFNVSSKVAYLYKNHLNKNMKISLSLLKDYTKEELDKIKIESKSLEEFYLRFFNKDIADTFKNINDLDLKNIIFNVESLGDFEHAQVACGGIKTEEINTKTLESKIVKNLYFAGDILDADAVCGGYNLSFAMLTGMKVGEEVE